MGNAPSQSINNEKKMEDLKNLVIEIKNEMTTEDENNKLKKVLNELAAILTKDLETSEAARGATTSEAARGATTSVAPKESAAAENSAEPSLINRGGGIKKIRNTRNRRNRRNRRNTKKR